MLVTTRSRLNHIEETRLDVYIGEFKLVQAECIDYLGMKIDENISWNAQTDSLCKKLVFIVSRLSRLIKVIPSYMLAYNIYIFYFFSIIQPKIDYAITLWAYTSHVNKTYSKYNDCKIEQQELYLETMTMLTLEVLNR